jgi:SAM-dependent methyltransferase
MALREVFVFYQYIKNFMLQLGHSLSTRSAVLDFGSGWGRLTRIFWNDIDEDCLYGVDVDPEIVSLCKMLGVPGQFQTIEARGHLPYEDATFDLIISYSVFSHLPEVIASDWMRELSRVAKPGAILAYTVQPKRFLSMILEIPEGTSSIWLKGLSRYKSLIPGLLQEFDKGMFCQLPTSGGTSLTDTVSDASTPARVVSKYRGEDVYADVAIPEAFIKLNWEKYFRLIRYLDDPERFQLLLYARKLWSKPINFCLHDPDSFLEKESRSCAGICFGRAMNSVGSNRIYRPMCAALSGLTIAGSSAGSSCQEQLPLDRC